MRIEIAPLVSYAFGVLFSIFAGAFLGNVVSLFLIWSLHLSPDLYRWLFFPVSFGFGGSIFMAGRHQKPVDLGHLGVLRFLKQRLVLIFTVTLLLTEGYHWGIPKMTDYVQVSKKIQTSRIISEQALSRDNVLMTAFMFYKFLIENESGYLGAEDEVTSLEMIGLQALRNGMADEDSSQLTQSESHAFLSRRVKDAMTKVAAKDYGIVLQDVYVTSVRLPADLENALTLARINSAKIEAEKILLQAFVVRAEELKRTGISPENAVQIIQNERGTLKSTSEIRRIEASREITDAIVAAVKQAFGRN